MARRRRPTSRRTTISSSCCSASASSAHGKAADRVFAVAVPVLVNGGAVSGCLYLATLVDGAEVATIEHSPTGELDAVQQAFVECGAFQCGFCTPGFVLMTRQLLDEKPEPTDDEIRHYLSGNLCRCAAYPEIVAAVKLAATRRRNA